MAPVLIVGVPGFEVDAVLRAGVGPALPAGARCPGCAGGLGPWGGYPRFVRDAGAVFVLWVARCRCVGCGATHALLPDFLFARRRDLAVRIGFALARAAEGAGHRPLAGALSVPEGTVRGWLRVARRRAAQRGAGFALLQAQLGAEPARAPPSGEPLRLLCEQVAWAHRAARGRLSERAVAACPWAFSSAASGGLLLCNTDSPF